jgi:protein-S-isoprenylcysteine O-methyltransferase Ste14
MTMLGFAALLHWQTPLGEVPVMPSAWLGLGALLAGFAIMMQAWWQFRQNDVAICPTAPTQRLLTDGIYTLTRNPMYLGIVLMLSGIAIGFGTLPFVLAAIAWWAVIQFAFCPYEEQKLLNTFGNEYRRYRARVRRWI